jgi:predicted alpha-1,2-mannosidase
MKFLRIILLLPLLIAATVVFSQNPLPEWALGGFVRPEGVNPVIKPNPNSRFYCPMRKAQVGWEESDTFNPAAAVKDGKICVLYRAEDNSATGIGARTSRIGFAESVDGIHLQRRDTPVLFPAEDAAKEYEWPGGCEDPRIAVTKDGLYVMMYTSWNRKVPRLSVATSRDLLTWEKHGPAFAAAYNGRFKDMACKSGSIVTKIEKGKQVIAKVNGKYLMYWGESLVAAATSDDLIKWTPVLDEKNELLGLIHPRAYYFDSALTECGPPAVITDKGILLLYNGKNRKDDKSDPRFNAGTYSAGQVLFDLKNPYKAIDRLNAPFFRPMADFEKSGQYTDGTVFIEGLVFHQNKWFLYYGCADSQVGVAIYDPAHPTGGDPIDTAQKAQKKTTTGFNRLSDYVDPFIGASINGETGMAYTLGKTFPGATSPFGLVQLNPNTITGGDNGPGYSYEHTSIEGFAFTQMSGIGWYGDLGNFLTIPTIGELKTISGSLDKPEGGYRSRYDKASEIAQAGYYATKLTDYDIQVEATVSPHAGMLRFTYPENKQSRIQIDLARRVGGSSAWQTVKIVDDYTISGKMECTPKEGGWGNGTGNAKYTVYYYAQFSKPLKNQGVWSAAIPDGMPLKTWDLDKDDYKACIAHSEIIRGKKEYEGKHLGFFTEFETKKDEQVLMKVGISFVSLEGAEMNLKADISDWDFDKVHEQVRTLWDSALGKMTISGGTDAQKTIFYTALYHTMIDPRLYSDVDGKYPGGDYQIHETTFFNKRTIFSGWDVFRSQMPLLTIINPKITVDMINSLVTLAEESGKEYLERWEFLNAYSGCMIGNPAISVIADAYAKGIRGFDIEKAYLYSANSTEKFGNGALGYCPGSISETLEYAYTEWCMSELARLLGKEADQAKYLKLSKSYQNIWDTEIRWFRPRKADGAFADVPKKGRLQEDWGSVESNPYQQGWFVPHDIDGLVDLIGSREATVADLDNMFENTPYHFLWNENYNHANEPVHHIPFMYNRLGEPWKTQRWSRFICENAYQTGVYGLVGNEDVGQLSAWYVLAASGIHPVCPGETRFEITTPIFNRIEFNLDNGKKFTVSAVHNSPKNVYIQSAKLNGKAYNKCYIEYTDIMNGGKLELVLGNQPNVKWGLENIYKK